MHQKCVIILGDYFDADPSVNVIMYAEIKGEYVPDYKNKRSKWTRCKNALKDKFIKMKID